MKLNLFLSIAFYLSTLFAYAAPHHGEPFKFKQPDGSFVTVKLYGDEFYMRAESVDGFTLIRDESTGWICYAKLSIDKKKLISTGIKFTENLKTDKSQLKQSGIKEHLDISESERILISLSNRTVLKRDLSTKSNSSTLKTSKVAVNGTIKGLAILVDFSDSTSPITVNSIKDFFNKAGYNGYGNNGSVKDFFSDISGGAVVYENVVYGYYRAPKTFATYDAMPYAAGAQEILYAALNWINNQGFDFSTLSIKNGRIQAINLMYTGNPAAWAKGMWYHQGTYTGFSADGVTSGSYNTSPINSDLSIGTICHENGHMLASWPDTYSYDGTPDGIGAFDLMCSYGNGKNPTPPNPYFRSLAGWGTTVSINSVNQAYTENSNSLQSYKYTNPSNSAEFYLIEPRKKTGRSTFLPDEGLTIWHINENGNNQSASKQVMLEHANNNTNNHTEACWHSGGATTFNDNTAPSAKWINGTSSNLKVSAVSSVSNSMSFTIGNGTTTGAEKASITSPVAGSVLSSSSVTFNWNKPAGATSYDLIVGTTGAGSSNIRSSATTASTSLTVSNLPTNGSTVYVRLWTLNGTWQYTDYTYTAYTPSAGKASITSPVAGSVLSSSSVTFNWNKPAGATYFDLIVGTTGAGSSNVRSSATFTTTSQTVSGLPTDGSTVYVRLWTLNGSWQYTDYTYTSTISNGSASISNPIPGSLINSSTVSFNWNKPAGATHFDILIGTNGPGSTNIRSSSVTTTTSKIVSGLPTNGSPIYVRLWTLNGTWKYNDYVYNVNAAPLYALTNLIEEINIYPNPAKDKFTINLTSFKNTNVSIFNVHGQLVYKIQPSTNSVEVDASNFESGLYLVHIINDTENITKKVIIK